MTIDSEYIPQTYELNQARQYTFTFEHIGSGTIRVFYSSTDPDTGDTVYDQLGEGEYEIALGPVDAGIYEGGTVTISATPPAGAEGVLVSRSTPITQLVDYQPYSPFPAEVTEFALDKATLIDQELAVRAGDSSAGGGDPGGPGGSNLFIPLSGTLSGLPVTGLLRWQNGTSAWNQLQGSLFGVNAMQFTAVNNNAAFYITTKSSTGTNQTFTFTQNGGFEIPSADAGNNEVWVFQADTFLGDPNALGIYSYDKNTNQRTSNIFNVYTTPSQAFSFGTDGKMVATGVIQPADSDQVLATKKYVDDNIGGAGGLPPASPGSLLVGNSADTDWHKSAHITIDEDTLPGLSNMQLKGAIAFNNITTPGEFMYIWNDTTAFGTHSMKLVGTGPTSAVLIEPEGDGAGNAFAFANGFLSLPLDPTSDTHAVRLGYLNDGFVTTSGDQTIAGVKEFTDQLVVRDTLAVDGAIASGTLTQVGALLEVGQFGIIQQSAAPSPTNTVTINTPQTITAAKTFSATTTSFQAVSAATNFASGNLTQGQMLNVGQFGVIQNAGFTSSSIALNTVSITAGNGLTGGGTIAATRTINVGAGSGISVAADSVAVDGTVLRTTGNQTKSGDLTVTNLTANNNIASGTLGGGGTAPVYATSLGILTRSAGAFSDDQNTKVRALITSVADILNATPGQKAAIDSLLTSEGF